MNLYNNKFSIKKLKINGILISLLLLLCVLSYEKTIHNSFYDRALIIVLGIGVTLFVINFPRKDIFNKYYKQLVKNNFIHVLVLTLVFSSLYNSIVLSSLNVRLFINVILMIVSFYVFYLFIPLLIKENENSFLNKLTIVISGISIIGIYIVIKGELLNYHMFYDRAQSILFDPNYFGTLSAIGVLLCVKKGKKNIFLGLINLIALYYSGSRGAMLSLLISVLIGYLLFKKNNIKKMITYIIIILAFSGGIYLMYRLNFFRTYQGTSGRDSLVSTSISLMKNRPFWGYGDFSEAFQKLKMSNASSHNGVIDFTLRYGIVPLIIYIAIIIKGFVKGVQNKTTVRILLITILLSINMNTIVISLGGIGGLSLIYTLFLGLSNINTSKRGDWHDKDPIYKKQ